MSEEELLKIEIILDKIYKAFEISKADEVL